MDPDTIIDLILLALAGAKTPELVNLTQHLHRLIVVGAMNDAIRENLRLDFDTLFRNAFPPADPGIQDPSSPPLHGLRQTEYPGEPEGFGLRS